MSILLVGTLAALEIVACLGDPPPVAVLDAGSDATGFDAPANDAPSVDGGNDAESSVDAADAGPAPRPISPLSTATVTSRSPTVRWELPTGITTVTVEVCPNRACTLPEQTKLVTGTQVTLDQLTPGPHFWRVRSMSGGTASSATSPTWEMFVGHTSAPTDVSWGVACDFDGDGLADPIIGALGSQEVRLFHGGASSTAVDLPTPDDGGRAENFGRPACAGDLDGDGYADLAVGSFDYAGGGPSKGHVYLYRGGPSGISSAAKPTAEISSPFSENPGADTQFAREVVGVGDVDGDGYADLAVGAEVLKTGTDAGGPSFGAAFIYYGGPAMTTAGPTRIQRLIDGSNNDFYFGASIGAAGDVNGDGFADIIVSGRFGNQNRLFYGATGGAKGLVNGSFTEFPVPTGYTVESGGYSGLSQLSRTPGDVNGDGYADLVIGDPGAPYPGDGGSGPGSVVIYFGKSMISASRSPDFTIDAVAGSPGFFGFGLALGDANGDGYDDLVIGAAIDPGKVYVFPGSATINGVSATNHIDIAPPDTFTANSGLSWGFAVVARGDVTGDHIGDFVVAPGLGERGYVYGTQPNGGLGVLRLLQLPGGFTTPAPD